MANRTKDSDGVPISLDSVLENIGLLEAGKKPILLGLTVDPTYFDNILKAIAKYGSPTAESWDMEHIYLTASSVQKARELVHDLVEGDIHHLSPGIFKMKVADMNVSAYHENKYR